MYLLFDIGGTHTRIAFSRGKNLQNIKIYDTPRDFDPAIRIFEEIARDQKITACAGGIACTLNQDKTVCEFAANLPSWSGKPVKKELDRVFKCPVHLQNDAAMAALGEAVFGAGKGYKTVGFLTIGTGVGGAKIVNGEIAEAAEPGHSIIIEADELENLISGPAIKKKYGETPNWDEICKYLSIGLKELFDKWTPEVFILGGGVVNSLPLEKLQPIGIPIIKASLRDKAGLYGALEYLHQT